ncbi:MAG: DNA methyltransferase [Bacillota bacterium]
MRAVAAYPLEERTAWRRWVTPAPLASRPVHRWYVFPHSFAAELVYALIDEWGLGPGDHILDPFAGAGTTVLAARERGIPATGYDLSPLAVLATRTKIAGLDRGRLCTLGALLLGSEAELSRARGCGAPAQRADYPELVRMALPGELLDRFTTFLGAIEALPAAQAERDFFRLALLGVVPRYSRAVATGGWLKWVERTGDGETIGRVLGERIGVMLSDLREVCLAGGPYWRVDLADARRLPVAGPTFTAVITSPPYPNRHDHTRVFGVELLLALADRERTRRLRYQSFHSHPEARPVRPPAPGYRPPAALRDAVARLRAGPIDRRIPAMLEGYFLDMYLVLHEIRRVCHQGARVALVVGNAQYRGIPIPVDELTAEVGQQAGLSCSRIVVVRYRGNSAQQMGRYGRRPQRESIVIFEAK